MKKVFKLSVLLLSALFMLFLISKTARNIMVNKDRAQIESEHFIINYQGIYRREAEEVSRRLEKKYHQVRSDLSDPEHGVITVFIHPSQEDFNKATGLAGSSASGTSRGPLEFHLVWTNWFNSIFPDDPVKTAVHEFVHCIQLNILIRDAMQTMNYKDEASFDMAFEKKFLEEYPQWLWEAVCTYQAHEVSTYSVNYGMRHNPLQDLNSGSQIYHVGYTIVEFLVSRWGKDKLPAFIRSYGDFESVLGVSEAEFEEAWHQYVEENY